MTQRRVINMCIFLYKVNIWNVNCAQALAIIFNSSSDVLKKSVEVLKTKCLDTEETFKRIPTFGFMPSALRFELPRADMCYLVVWITGSGGLFLFSKVVFLYCVRATALLFDPRADDLEKTWNFLRQKISRSRGRLEPATVGFIALYIKPWRGVFFTTH